MVRYVFRKGTDRAFAEQLAAPERPQSANDNYSLEGSENA